VRGNSNHPIQGEDKTMYILTKEEILLKNIEEHDTVIHVSKDGKSFSVIKHRHIPEVTDIYHISQLQHILMAGNK
jgi:hypothetical protein